jgi:hypothetical protein
MDPKISKRPTVAYFCRLTPRLMFFGGVEGVLAPFSGFLGHFAIIFLGFFG